MYPHSCCVSISFILLTQGGLFLPCVRYLYVALDRASERVSWSAGSDLHARIYFLETGPTFFCIYITFVVPFTFYLGLLSHYLSREI